MLLSDNSIVKRDPVTFEVIKNALYATCAEMKSVIMRTSISPLLSLHPCTASVAAINRTSGLRR